MQVDRRDTGPLPCRATAMIAGKQCTARHITIVRVEPESTGQQLLVAYRAFPDQVSPADKMVEQRCRREFSAVGRFEQARNDQPVHQDSVS